MNKIREIVRKARLRDSITWILKAAVNNPNCIIVTDDIFTAKKLKNHYFKIVNEQNWLKRVWWKIFNRKHPVFCSVDYNGFDNTDKPIILATIYNSDPREQESKSGLVTYEDEFVMPLGKINKKDSGKLIAYEKGTIFNP